MPGVTVILLAPQSSIEFKNALYCKIDDIPMIRLGFASHTFLELFGAPEYYKHEASKRKGIKLKTT